MSDGIIRPRAVGIEDAASYVGCRSLKQFRREVKQGLWPGPITLNSRPPRWSLLQLDEALTGKPGEDHGDVITRARARFDKRFG